MKVTVLIFLLVAFTDCFANDGAYYVSGNHLIPMYESDIVVKKEILTIKRISDDNVTITVYYEFFNRKNSKQLDVGFEASSPEGDMFFVLQICKAISRNRNGTKKTKTTRPISPA
jgi:hypothetical protein